MDETAFLRATGTHPTLLATGITDLTPGRPARLLDVVEGRSGTVLGSWLAERDDAWRAGVHTASLDPFRGYAAALATHLPHAERVLDPFHVVRLGRTLHAWRREMCAHFDHPAVSNGPTENLNLKIKNNKRIARGFRNFTHYRLRLLLNHGCIREDHSPTRIRTRRPRFAA